MQYLNKKNIIFGVLCVLLAISILVIIYLAFNESECICDNNSLLLNETTTTTSTIKVEVKGEVASPGVYEVEDGARVVDVINLANGFTDNAYTEDINLSKKVSDEFVIYVNNKKSAKNTTKVTSNATYNASSETTKTSGLININTASKTELMKLSGIGESKAEAIIEYREKNGNFTKISDIKKVSGIGSSTYEKFKDSICV